MRTCQKCGDSYREGMYFAHRQKPSHLLKLGHAYARNQRDRECRVCHRAGKERAYFTGGYDTHIKSDDHLRSLESVRQSRNAELARVQLDVRDEFIAKSLVDNNLSYREVGLLFGISRQRVHQIAKSIGVVSTNNTETMHKRRRDTKFVECFVCGYLYRRKEWNIHAHVRHHQACLHALADRIGKYRRT